MAQLRKAHKTQQLARGWQSYELSWTSLNPGFVGQQQTAPHHELRLDGGRIIRAVWPPDQPPGIVLCNLQPRTRTWGTGQPRASTSRRWMSAQETRRLPDQSPSCLSPTATTLDYATDRLCTWHRAPSFQARPSQQSHGTFRQDSPSPQLAASDTNQQPAQRGASYLFFFLWMLPLSGALIAAGGRGGAAMAQFDENEQARCPWYQPGN